LSESTDTTGQIVHFYK